MNLESEEKEIKVGQAFICLDGFFKNNLMVLLKLGERYCFYNLTRPGAMHAPFTTLKGAVDDMGNINKYYKKIKLTHSEIGG